jgi:hypothetical protein
VTFRQQLGVLFRCIVVCTIKIDRPHQLAVFVQNVDTIMRHRLSPTGDTILTASLAVGVEILVPYELPPMGGVLSGAASPEASQPPLPQVLPFAAPANGFFDFIDHLAELR